MDTSRPSVTVAIPTYNRASLVRESLRSVLAQTFTNFEVFVSDNASTDETEDVIASLDDPRVHYTRLEHNIGLTRNLTRCLHLGTAPYLAILPDDDLMLPRNLERKVEVLDRHSNVGLIHGAFNLIGADGQILLENPNWVGLEADTIVPGRGFIIRTLTVSPWVIIPSVMVRRSAVEGDSFMEADRPNNDLALWLRIARRADVAFVAEPLVSFRNHPGTQTARDGGYVSDSELPQTTIAGIAGIQHVKTRFLKRHGRELPDVRRIRAASRRWNQEQLMQVVRQRRHRHGSPLARWRLFREAAGVEPSLLLNPKAFRFLMGGLARTRGIRLVRVLLRRGQVWPGR